MDGQVERIRIEFESLWRDSLLTMAGSAVLFVQCAARGDGVLVRENWVTRQRSRRKMRMDAEQQQHANRKECHRRAICRPTEQLPELTYLLTPDREPKAAHQQDQAHEFVPAQRRCRVRPWTTALKRGDLGAGRPDVEECGSIVHARTPYLHLHAPLSFESEEGPLASERAGLPGGVEDQG